ncbi:hypothetical protein PUN50_27200 (plasmid) [Vibrio campbellii]|jgi:hypothetical protein|uniref:Uncharacterized protein n=2 Tax=Vibrio harveyi group TaxID=717610 RepID=A0AAU9QR05_9VIBR|nr:MULTISPECIES: hypothetical protein [Vibrio]MDK9773956.1 hypothetical protein [Vibrio sp. B181a]WDG11983.1 hypothetical protein PUN50_27200 [Vibrio campbellii]CAH1593459.1 conserved hypothetical protein [Vibrio jasicida]CAH1597698.1 conserved hypothetical protein [Vibrio jasicida]
MLAFLKRWRQAYLEDKGNRLHAELEDERNALCNERKLSFESITTELSKNNRNIFHDLADAAEEQYNENCQRGYYQ